MTGEMFRPAPAPAVRENLPWRRLTHTAQLEIGGHDFTVTVGFNQAGLAREVFVRSVRQGSELDAILTDGCIALSLAMQTAFSAAQLARHLSATDGYGASSALGRIIALVAEVEGEAGGAVRAFWKGRS